MPVYAYRARNDQGQLLEGTLEVPAEGELAHRLSAQGLMLTTAKKVKSTRRSASGQMRISRKEFITLTYNLETIYSSGIPLVEGLRDLANNAGNPSTSHVAGCLADDIRRGADLSEAMDRHWKSFPQVYRNVVKAGETAGAPGPVLKRLAEYYQWLAEIRSMALRAFTYPLVLAGAVCGLIVLLLTFLVPRILNVLARMRAEIPMPTRVLMAVSNCLKDNILIIGAAILVGVVGFFCFARTPKGRMAVDKLKLRVPVLGPLMAKISAARFVSTLGMLYQAGIGTIEALEAAENVVGNAYMAKGVRQAREAVIQGDTLADALRRTRSFQPLVVRMVGLGEQTGTLGEALDRVSSFYDREIPQTIKSVLSLLEPAMILGAGVAVGFILLCTFLPIFEMVKSLSG